MSSPESVLPVYFQLRWNACSQVLYFCFALFFIVDITRFICYQKQEYSKHLYAKISSPMRKITRKTITAEPNRKMFLSPLLHSARFCFWHKNTARCNQFTKVSSEIHPFRSLLISSANKQYLYYLFMYSYWSWKFIVFISFLLSPL